MKPVALVSPASVPAVDGCW